MRKDIGKRKINWADGEVSALEVFRKPGQTQVKRSGEGYHYGGKKTFKADKQGKKKANPVERSCKTKKRTALLGNHEKKGGEKNRQMQKIPAREEGGTFNRREKKSGRNRENTGQSKWRVEKLETILIIGGQSGIKGKRLTRGRPGVVGPAERHPPP